MTSIERLDRVLVMELVRVTEAAAIAASRMVGLGDEKGADRVAVEAMRAALNELPIDGTVVIGEGERDKAPMLFIGEKVGTGEGPKIDIALDPLEGTRITAKGGANALAVVAMAADGHLLNAPDTYMEKIAIGSGYKKGLVDLDREPAENVRNLAAAKGVDLSKITACILDRPRHDEIMRQLREIGCRMQLISDGDVEGAMRTALPDNNVDIYMGTGGAPEGVLAAAALQCFGGQFQGRLVFRDEDEKGRANRIGITDLDKKYDIDDLAQGDVIFAATGVTDGALLKGVRKSRFGGLSTQTLVLRAASHTIRWVETDHILA
jgi:fructose-1,6-bisphosphatase II / sedoheptulose-1,7-bisphosphatase